MEIPVKLNPAAEYERRASVAKWLRFSVGAIWENNFSKLVLVCVVPEDTFVALVVTFSTGKFLSSLRPGNFGVGAGTTIIKRAPPYFWSVYDGK